MHANDVQVSRVYSREIKGTILDQTFAEGQKVEIALDAEAGSTVFGDAVPYRVEVWVRDMRENFEIDYEFSQEGQLGDANWPNQANTFEFRIDNTNRLQKDHIFNVLAILSVGKKNPNVSFAESPPFCITAK